jgi:hypothetical protein
MQTHFQIETELTCSRQATICAPRAALRGTKCTRQAMAVALCSRAHSSYLESRHISLFYYFLLLLLLTAIGLSPGGSSPALVQTKIKIHKTTMCTRHESTYVTLRL